MNPIEHLWEILQRELNAFQPRPTTAPQLEQAIRQIWTTINMATVNRLVRSMRCQALVNANGGHTRY
ncbi:hypothetical protein V1264_016175 [Littorina saxatilis]|uniref:Uncharacterized protein n=1 Tax=Littorina saxatilis TaxID=31220 RepID=A0AAN9BNH8_9CAEN